MRRLLSFFAMAATVIAIMVFAGPQSLETPNYGREYVGGYEFVYEVEYREHNADAVKIEDAAKDVAERLEVLNTNPIVYIDGDTTIRVAVPESIDHNLVEAVLESDGEITFTDGSGEILMLGSDIFAENQGMVVYQNGSSYNLAIILKDATKINEVTTELAQNQGQLMIWAGFDDGSETGTNDAERINSQDLAVAQKAAAKLISAANITEALNTTQLSVPIATANVSKVRALIGISQMEYVLSNGSTIQIETPYGENAFMVTAIALAVALLVVIVLMFVFYKLLGLVTTICLLFFGFGVLVIFPWLSGIYDPAAIAALVIGVGLAIDACVVHFERIKEEIYKGRSVLSSYQEGSKKSLSAVIDSNVIMILIGCVAYFFGKGEVKNFAIMLLSCEIMVILSMILLGRLLTWLLVSSKVFDTNKKLLGVKTSLVPDISKGEIQTYQNRYEKVDFMKKSKKTFTVLGGVIAVGAIVALVLGLTMSQPVNYGKTFEETTSITISIQDTDKFDLDFLRDEEGNITKDSVVAYFEDDYELTRGETISNISLINYTVNDKDCLDLKLEYPHYFSRLVDIDIAFVEHHPTLNDEVNKELINVLYQTSTPVNTTAPILNALMVLGIAVVAVIIYMLIRFRLSYALSVVVSLVGSLLTYIALFAIIRIPVDVEFVYATIAVLGFGVFNAVVVYDRIKEISKETNYGKINYEDRFEISNKAIRATMDRTVFVIGAVALLALTMILTFNESVLVFASYLLVGMLLVVVATVVVAPCLWIALDNKQKIKTRTRKTKKAKKVRKGDDVEELIIVGIND